MRAVALISWWQLRNSLRTLLSDPRKLFGTLAVLIGVSCGLGSMFIGSSLPKGFSAPSVQVDQAVVLAVIRALLFVVGLSTIHGGLGDSLLAFQQADVDYLFPSPVRRQVVMLYKLPRLTFQAIAFGFFIIFLLKTYSNILGREIGGISSVANIGSISFLAMFLGLGAYLNLTLCVSMRVLERGRLRTIVMSLMGALILWVGASYRQNGLPGLVTTVGSPLLRYALWPSDLVARVLMNDVQGVPAGSSLYLLWALYGASLVLLFGWDANFYEESIASTERFSALRSAAKGGVASVMAHKAANFKRRSAREFTIAPFGRGSVAVFWAHLCASAKRPLANGGTTLAIGLTAGAIVGLMSRENAMGSTAALFVVVLYGSMGFLVAAKTASESAIRHREVLAPLPIGSWQMVAANLGVPTLGVVIFSVGVCIGFLGTGGLNWPVVVFGILVVYPIRMAGRMAVQYLTVLIYPDLSDKAQQLFSQLFAYLLFTPMVIAEGLVCVPALVMGSTWGVMVTLLIVQFPLLAGSLLLAGRASERAAKTGEPVTLGAILRR